MSTDILVLIHSVVGIILFVGVHALVVRLKKDTGMLMGIIMVFIGVGTLLSISEWHYAGVSPWEFFPAMLFTLSITGLVDFCYILALFGIATTSIRMQILMELSKYRSGMTKEALLRVYNKEHVIGQRVVRLVSSGELDKTGRVYRMGQSFSYFNMHTQIIAVLFSLYGVKKIGREDEG